MEATPRMFTLGRVLWGWASLCAVSWLFLGVLAEAEEAECRAESGWFCFEPGVALALLAVLALIAWAIGSAAIAIAWKLIEVGLNAHRRRGH
jgi:hypothetical protein